VTWIFPSTTDYCSHRPVGGHPATTQHRRATGPWLQH
jgi:hypothetical protein